MHLRTCPDHLFEFPRPAFGAVIGDIRAPDWPRYATPEEKFEFIHFHRLAKKIVGSRSDRFDRIFSSRSDPK